MSSIPLILDNTKRSTFRQCKMKYFLQHVKGLQPNYGSTALRYGTTWHGIQEGYHQYVKENGWPTDQLEHIAALTAGLTLGKKKWDIETASQTYMDDYKNFNTAVEAFNEYLEFFSEDNHYIEVLDTEKKFECLIEPENDVEQAIISKLPPIIFTGRIDLSVRMDHMNWIWDFKTTGWYLDKVILEANRSPQLIGYSYAGKKVLDFEPDGCLCSFAYIGSTKSKVTGNWGKIRSSFRRAPQIFTDGDISAWKLSFLDTCRELDFAMKENLWPQSFDNCYRYGACPFLKLCQQHVPFEDLNTEDFHVAFWDVLKED